MKIAVTGSIATDHLMHFPGKFADQLIADQLHKVSLSFLVDDLVVRRGGVASNIAFGMGQLGLHPILVGAVGADFADYRSWLERHGVDCGSVHVSGVAHTARFVCTTDDDLNQIASFYAGAMAEARNIELKPVADRAGGLDLVLISANDPAAILLTNDYERSLLEQKARLTGEQVLDHVKVRVTTLGKQGVEISGRDIERIHVPVARDVIPDDPTGVGDGFRAGFFSAISWGLGLERAAQVGSLVAALVLETVGPQEYEIKGDFFAKRFADSYGDDAAAEVHPYLPA